MGYVQSAGMFQEKINYKPTKKYIPQTKKTRAIKGYFVGLFFKNTDSKAEEKSVPVIFNPERLAR